jgi:hypothetical protein
VLQYQKQEILSVRTATIKCVWLEPFGKSKFIILDEATVSADNDWMPELRYYSIKELKQYFIMYCTQIENSSSRLR